MGHWPSHHPGPAKRRGQQHTTSAGPSPRRGDTHAFGARPSSDRRACRARRLIGTGLRRRPVHPYHFQAPVRPLVRRKGKVRIQWRPTSLRQEDKAAEEHGDQGHRPTQRPQSRRTAPDEHQRATTMPATNAPRPMRAMALPSIAVVLPHDQRSSRTRRTMRGPGQIPGEARRAALRPPQVRRDNPSAHHKAGKGAKGEKPGEQQRPAPGNREQGGRVEQRDEDDRSEDSFTHRRTRPPRLIRSRH